MKRLVMIAALLGLSAGTAAGFSGSDPNWPCIQRKQPHLSLGQVWTGPVPTEEDEGLAREKEISDLAERLVQRRMPLAEAEAEIAAFAETADNHRLTALMLAIFQHIDRDRSGLIEGIARYGHKQVDLAASIESRRAQMAELESAEELDFDAIDVAEEALDWDMRIFTDRQHALTYVCETPVLMEQRAFALGRSIAAGLHE